MANPNAPLDLPLLPHKLLNYCLDYISEIAIFSLNFISLHLINFFCLKPLQVEHTAGAVFFACSFLRYTIMR